MAKKARTHRGGRGLFGRPPSRSTLSVGAARRADKVAAEQEYSDLVAIFEDIKAELKEHLAQGRFDYRKSLERIYRLVWDWDHDGDLQSRLKAIARLRGVPSGGSANRFNGIVALCHHRAAKEKRRTVSRWSLQLEDAFEREIPPKRLMTFLEDPSSLGRKMKWGKSSKGTCVNRA